MDANNKFQKQLTAALLFTVFIYASLYFMPFLSAALREAVLLKKTIDSTYIAFGFFVVILLLRKYKVYSLKAYLLFAFLLALFLYEFFNAQYLVERFHFLEYALLFGFWFRAIRYKVKGWHAYWVTFLWSSLVGVGDEGIQYLLPNRHFEWRDVLLNVEGVLFGVAAVGILMIYRQDKGNCSGKF